MSEEKRQEITDDMVGPVLRDGHLAEAVADAIIDDNPEKEVFVIDGGDYVRIHTLHSCRVTRASIERQLGRAFPLAMLEAEMPSFKGRMESSSNELRWFYAS